MGVYLLEKNSAVSCAVVAALADFVDLAGFAGDFAVFEMTWAFF